MSVSGGLLFFFSGLGVFNALLISFYFFFIKKPKNISNFFFGFLLLMLSIRVGKSVFYFFNSNLALVFLKIGLTACILIGPALYFYTLSVVHPDRKMRFWKLHFVVLLVAAITIGLLFPETHNPIIVGNICWMTIVYYVWLAFIIATAWIVRHTLLKIVKKNEQWTSLEFWVISIFFGNLLIWIAYNTVAYTSYIAGALSFSFIFYVLFLLIHFSRTQGAIFNKSLKYANKKIESDEADSLSTKLNLLMESEKLYTDGNLKLSDVAKRMNISPQTLSQFINDNLGKSFTLLINEYRIREAKEIIKSNAYIKLEAVGYDCGFNSKSTFYATFKKIVGTTPSKFKEKNS